MGTKKNNGLMKISTYARKIKKSVQWVYSLEKQGKITIEEIDGVKFVKTN